MKATTATLSVLTIAALGSSAYATTLYVLDATTFTSKLSGKGPSTTYVAPGGGVDYQAMYSISMWEERDVPCKVEGKSRHINTYVTKTSTYEDSRCTEKAKKTVSFTDTETYIRGVNVCLNKSGDRVKGVRIYGTELDRTTGALTNKTGFKEFSRPNCNTWQTPVYCSTGKIATKLKIGYQFQSLIPNEIQGIGLTCRAPEKK